MYKLKYVKSNGDIFYFDPEHRILYNLEPLSEVDVTISESQGFEQVGTTIENRSVGGVSRSITGRILGYANETKEEMLKIFSPFSEGKLYFNDRYYCDCVVEATPVIGSVKWDPGYQIDLRCAYPFWMEDEETSVSSTVYTPCFHFPGPTSGENGEYHNYDTHIFAIKNEATFFVIYNESEVDTRFDVTFYTATAIISNYGVINARTLEKIQINDTLEPGEITRVYWDGAELRVEKTVNGVTTDIFALLDEDSNLFWLRQGENVFQAFAESEAYPDILVRYNRTYVGVYDGK